MAKALGVLRKERDPVRWAEDNYRIKETGEPIRLAPHQAAVLRYALSRDGEGRFPFSTIIYSTPKKSGKTTVAGMVGRWAAETWGPYQEVLCVGNDLKQARERAFASIKESIELTPGYSRSRESLPGRWQVTTKEMRHTLNGSKVHAIATDYQGEAGANPSITIWTELWGFIHEAALRFWAEMAPSPTRLNSIRLVETYAGYEGESELLWELYESAVLNGRQLTAGELGPLGIFPEAPNADSLVPCYVNEAARMFAYWDTGEMARRMPWQQGERGAEYYAAEASTQTDSQMVRLHKNEWVSAESSFVPIVWWDACKNPLPLEPGDKTTPIVVVIDAAVTGDCFGLVAISRDPDRPDRATAVRAYRLWVPPKGGQIDFTAEGGPDQAVRELCEMCNVVEVAYDPYQLADMAQRLTREGVAWMRPFNQGQDRLIADMQLYTAIRDRMIRHGGGPEMREHIQNANAKQAAHEDTKLRLVKKSVGRKIDLAVCLSMGNHECLRLNL